MKGEGMKPYIQIVDKDGKVTYMHSERNGCDVLIAGDVPNEFSATVTDRKSSEGVEFCFEPEDIGQIISRTIASDTVAFVEALFDTWELYEQIESQELYYGEEGFDESLIVDFTNEFFGSDQKFFFRLVEEKDGKWTLRFVFHNKEVISVPRVWEEFSR